MGGRTRPETSRKHYLMRRAILTAAKDKPCQDCGVKYPPCVMDFDHRPGEVKLFLVSRRWCGKQKVADEIAKCDVVCANCHRLRTEARRQPK